MLRLTFTSSALVDSREILSKLLEAAGQRVAETYFGRFQSTFDRLCRFPRSGAPRPRLGRGVRLAVVRPYLIFYRANDVEVQIVRVVDGRRRITRRTMNMP